MSARHVLGVLDGEGPGAWDTCRCAVRLADRERAALTLAMATDPGWFARWFAPPALQPLALSPGSLDFVELATDALARMVEFVPADVPLTTRLLSSRTSTGLIELIRRGSYDTVVVPGGLARCRRVRRELTRLQVRAVVPIPTSSLRPSDGDLVLA